jgi:hypothetical protein
MGVTDRGLKPPVIIESWYWYPLAPITGTFVFRCDSMQFTGFVLVVLAILSVDLKLVAPATPSTNKGNT